MLSSYHLSVGSLTFRYVFRNHASTLSASELHYKIIDQQDNKIDLLQHMKTISRLFGCIVRHESLLLVARSILLP